jgi:hypothetical protein
LGLLNKDDDGLVMAVCDVLVDLPPSPRTASIVGRLLDSASRGEVYEFLVSSIVASRRQDLVSMVVEALPREMSQKRLQAAHTALQLAPQTQEVSAAIDELQRRIAKQTSPR